MSSSRLEHERDWLAAQVAKRVWVANGGRMSDEAQVEGSLLALEALAMRFLADDVLGMSLALRFLQALDEALRTSDYEDRRSVAAERRWAEGYLAGRLQCSLVPGEGLGLGGVAAGELAARLHARLAARVAAELKAAEIAA